MPALPPSTGRLFVYVSGRSNNFLNAYELGTGGEQRFVVDKDVCDILGATFTYMDLPAGTHTVSADDVDKFLGFRKGRYEVKANITDSHAVYVRIDKVSQDGVHTVPRLVDAAAATSKLHPNWSFSSDENAPLAEGSSTRSRQTLSVQSDEGAGASRRVATTAQGQIVGDSGGLTLSARAKRSDRIAISSDDVTAKPLPSDQGTDSAATLPSWVDDRSPQGRKRTIMARYVFGDELKPGERWKRRLLTKR
jgi:hypothetical protein